MRHPLNRQRKQFLKEGQLCEKLQEVVESSKDLYIKTWSSRFLNLLVVTHMLRGRPVGDMATGIVVLYCGKRNHNMNT